MSCTSFFRVYDALYVDCSRLHDVHLCVQLLCLNTSRVYTEMYSTQNGHLFLHYLSGRFPIHHPIGWHGLFWSISFMLGMKSLRVFGHPYPLPYSLSRMHQHTHPLPWCQWIFYPPSVSFSVPFLPLGSISTDFLLLVCSVPSFQLTWK